MERERRTHRRGNNLLICFSWGSTISSMKLSNNKLLSSSLSRRLRSKGSMKGSSAGKASPLFRTGSKKKGGCGAFENDEPSSPKVTCIGLVRVKTKKNNQARKMRSRSKRRGGEVSFRRVEQIGQEGSIVINNVVHEHRNHRWIHLPFAICEALKGLRSELNCLLPCGGRSSSCTNWGREREKASSSCGAVFMRWLFALQEGEEKKENVSREVVINHEVDQVSEISSDEIRGEALKEEIGNEAVEEDEEEQEDGRVSICVPPSNALLLMRSRSEPYRTSSLATRFWDSPTPKPHDKYNAHEEKEITPIAKTVSVVIMEEHESLQKEAREEENLEKIESKQEATIAAQEEEEEEEEEREYKHKRSSPEAVLEEGNPAIKEMEGEYSKLQEELDERAKCENSSSYHTISVLQPENDEPEPKPAPEMLVAAEELVAALEEERVLDQRWAEVKSETQERPPKQQQEEGTEIQEPRFEPEAEQEQHIIIIEEEELEGEERGRMSNESDRAALLPDCLLLMMREPKVSMELSKETWVCSTDFIRPHHHHQNLQSENKVKPINGGNQPKKTHITLPSNSLRLRQQKPPQPPRSSCSKLELSQEKKPVTGKASEPSVLSRCKSEPIRSSAKLAPEACFWKNMKLEPHRQSTVGVSAAGVGF